MLICHDISQIKENLRLQELNKATNLMASYMSHEMITPLQCVSQLADKVSQDVDLENKYYLRTINTTIKLLLSTIKENLDSSMLSVSQFVLKPSNLALIESVI
jgi:signal transduction histidine kinase